MRNMQNYIPVLLLLIKIRIAGSSGVETSRYERDISIIDAVCPASDLDFGQQRSLTTCASVCKSVPSCTSFFYNLHDHMCMGSTSIIASAVGCDMKTGTLYYRPPVTDCVGDTYTKHTGMELNVPYQAEYTSVTLATCQQYCTDSTTCSGFNYGPSWLMCRVKDTSLSEADPSAFFAYSSVDYYERICT